MAFVEVAYVVESVHGQGAESETVPPRATEPPPERPEPAVTVTEEFCSWLLPIVDVETKDVPSYESSVPEVKDVALLPPLVIARAFPRVRVPSVAVCEKRFVDDAVVEKKLVEVPEVRERVPRVETPVMLRVATWKPLNRVDVALATKFPTFCIPRMLPGEEVPMPTLPVLVMRNASESEPAFKVENARSPFPPAKFCWSMEEMEAVEVPVPLAAS